MEETSNNNIQKGCRFVDIWKQGLPTAKQECWLVGRYLRLLQGDRFQVDMLLPSSGYDVEERIVGDQSPDGTMSQHRTLK